MADIVFQQAWEREEERRQDAAERFNQAVSIPTPYITYGDYRRSQNTCYDCVGCTAKKLMGRHEKWKCNSFKPITVPPRFTDNGDGTVTDNTTGLVWMKNADRLGLCTYDEALKRIGFLYTGFRLPTITELFSLIDHTQFLPALPVLSPFDYTISAHEGYWSSTRLASNSNFIWVVSIGSGHVTGRMSNEQAYVWPVRDKAVKS